MIWSIFDAAGVVEDKRGVLRQLRFGRLVCDVMAHQTTEEVC